MIINKIELFIIYKKYTRILDGNVMNNVIKKTFQKNEKIGLTNSI